MSSNALAADPPLATSPRDGVSPATDTFPIYEFRVLGNTKLPIRAIESAVYPLLGEGRSLAAVEAARDALVAAYRSAGFGTVLVDIPEQSVDDGVVRLQVTEGRIEKVRIAGARYYSERRILERLPAAKEGEIPNIPELQSQLSALQGEARDREVTPTLKPGSAPGTLVVDFGVKDALPLHGSLELNNRYSADTTRTRLVGSLSYENMFQRAETLGLQYQTAPQKPSEVEVFALTYLARTADPNRTWSAYAIRSKSDVAAIGTLAVIGNGTIIGARMNLTLASSVGHVQSLSFGGDWKDFGEDIRLPSDVSARTPIHYALWNVQYNYSAQGERLDVQHSIGVNLGIRGLGGNDAQFEFKRAGAHAGYSVLRGNSSLGWHLNRGWTLGARLAYQYSEQPLISNEQLALGGEDTVRGYLDAESLVDAGVVGAVELRTPGVTHGVSTFSGTLFYDRAYGMNQQPLNSEIASGSVRTDLAGWGLGLHYMVGQSLDAIVDWAMPEVRGSHTNARSSRFDFSVKYSF